MDGTMIEYSLVSVEFALLIRLGPVVAVEFAVPFAAWARYSC